MDERDISVFVDSVTHYFNHLGSERAEVQAPYLVERDELVLYDYTGIIGISGNRRGNIYFTAPKPMINYLLVSQGEPQLTHEHCSDMVGEIANTLSGNARRELGNEFMISVPMVMHGKPDQLMMARRSRSFVIPIKWRMYLAALVVSLE